MLSPSLATLRIFLHVLSAAVWVGGQIVLVGLVGPLRAVHVDAPRVMARAYNRIAWPAFAILFATGIWNVAAIKVSDTSTAYQLTLALKLIMVVVAGLASAVHVVSKSKAALAIGGALGLLGSLAATFLGVLLHVG